MCQRFWRRLITGSTSSTTVSAAIALPRWVSSRSRSVCASATVRGFSRSGVPAPPAALAYSLYLKPHRLPVGVAVRGEPVLGGLHHEYEYTLSRAGCFADDKYYQDVPCAHLARRGRRCLQSCGSLAHTRGHQCSRSCCRCDHSHRRRVPRGP